MRPRFTSRGTLQARRHRLIAAGDRGLDQFTGSRSVPELAIIGELQFDQPGRRAGLVQFRGLHGVIERVPRAVDMDFRVGCQNFQHLRARIEIPGAGKADQTWRFLGIAQFRWRGHVGAGRAAWSLRTHWSPLWPLSFKAEC